MDYWVVGNFWFEGVLEYVWFVFCKENKEFYEMFNVIVWVLKVNFKFIGVVGTKDKRGVIT